MHNAELPHQRTCGAYPTHPCQNQADERAFIPTKRSPVLLSKNYELCIEHYALSIMH